MEVEINGDLLSIMLLYSLLASFENFRCAIESRDNLPPPEDLKVKILVEADARNQSSPDSSGALAAESKRSSKAQRKEVASSQGSKDRRFKPRCFKCGRIGHKAPQCYAKDGTKANNAHGQAANLGRRIFCGAVQ